MAVIISNRAGNWGLDGSVVVTPDVPTGRTNPVSQSVQQGDFNVRYTKALDTTGWLVIHLEPNNGNVSVPEFTKVVLQRESNGRVYFLIKEGQYANRTASLKKENASKCLITANRGSGAIIRVKMGTYKDEYSKIRQQTLNQLFSILKFNNTSIRITLDSNSYYDDEYGNRVHSKPLPKGEYLIRTPQYPGKAEDTNFYRDDPMGYKNLKYDTVWFQLEYAPTNFSNFIHVGHLSHGCITCYDITKWNELYQFLISNRMDNPYYIGKVIIE